MNRRNLKSSGGFLMGGEVGRHVGSCVGEDEARGTRNNLMVYQHTFV